MKLQEIFRGRERIRFLIVCFAVAMFSSKFQFFGSHSHLLITIIFFLVQSMISFVSDNRQSHPHVFGFPLSFLKLIFVSDLQRLGH